MLVFWDIIRGIFIPNRNTTTDRNRSDLCLVDVFILVSIKIGKTRKKSVFLVLIKMYIQTSHFVSNVCNKNSEIFLLCIHFQKYI